MEETVPLLQPTFHERGLEITRRRRRREIITLVFVFLGVILSFGLFVFGKKWIRRDATHKTIHLLYSKNDWDFVAISEDQDIDDVTKKCFIYGKNKMDKNLEMEKFLIEKGIQLEPGSPFYLHQMFLKTGDEARDIAYCSSIAEYANRRMKEIGNSKTIFECITNKTTVCLEDNSYREIDGSCNNLQHPTWGKAFVPYLRLLEADYSDDISVPRKSKTGKELPSARTVSISLYRNKPHLESKATLLTMLWGLFVDHDITNTAISQGKDGVPITCCHKEIKANRSCLHPECYPISIADNDPFFCHYNATCMEFVRSSPVKAEGSVKRQQLNQITSFLDGSAVYGSSVEDMKTLRTYKRGMLLSNYIHNTEVLPIVSDQSSFCGLPKMKLYCFHAGDRRANEQVELTAIHTLWLREHNRVATELYKLNPQWDDEKIFQETRKIVSAELQHITYHEYLPLLFGHENLDKYDVKLLSSGYYHGYNPTLNPTIGNVFASAAFRFGHSQVQDFIQLVSSDDKRNKKIALHETFFNPTVLYAEGIDSIFRGITRQHSKAVWSQMTTEIQNRLFQSYHSQYGLDLPAISIQRGRDHGLPPYVKWRSYCNFSKINNWSDLNKILDVENVNVLKKLYETVEDIDLIPAALSEVKTGGHLLGPTHSCLIGEQFRRTRRGDRFWYENENVFSQGQLQEIRKVTLSRLLCDNSDGLISIQKWPLHPSSAWNYKVFCSNSTVLPRLDLRCWKSVESESNL